MFRLAASKSSMLLAGSIFSGIAFAQTPLWTDQPPAQSNQQQLITGNNSVTQVGAGMALSAASVTLPAGTRILMVLTSPLHTTSGTEGSGIYLETLHPVVLDNRVVIPAHTQVQGAVESNKRPGHIERTAEFKFHFTTLIFPNNHVVSINGVLQSIPGSRTTRAQRNDGTLRTVDQTEKVITPVAVGTVTGAILGSATRFGIGKFVGAGLGAGLGLGGVLLKRGDEISLRKGTNIEMVLQSPLSLEPEQAAFNAEYVPARESRLETKDASADENQLDGPKKGRPRRRPTSLHWPGEMLLPEYDRR